MNSIASFAKVNSGRSTLKAEITLCPCIPLPFQTEKDGSHISMTHAFSSTFFGFSLWLPENFGLFYCFSRLYVHSHRLCSVLPSGFRMFLDFFTAFLGFMSIFSCPVPYFPLASGCFWTFSCFFCVLCPFSPARLRISLWFPDDFGLFYCFSRLYVHFLLPGSVFPSGFRRILDFFLLFLCFMSILTGSAPYFSLASG